MNPWQLFLSKQPIDKTCLVKCTSMCSTKNWDSDFENASPFFELILYNSKEVFKYYVSEV